MSLGETNLLLVSKMPPEGLPIPAVHSTVSTTPFWVNLSIMLIPDSRVPFRRPGHLCDRPSCRSRSPDFAVSPTCSLSPHHLRSSKLFPSGLVVSSHSDPGSRLPPSWIAPIIPASFPGLVCAFPEPPNVIKLGRSFHLSEVPVPALLDLRVRDGSKGRKVGTQARTVARAGSSALYVMALAME